ncbi:MAG: CCA tRNA nucleotidyltransferase [Proteobacteria bacterium]|nr:CCA tRNA nucleotidyltransferase [Pseudomonadota bacterium]
MASPATAAVIAALTAEGAAVRFVGGCVRDAVAGRAVKDVDLATPDAPETVTRLLEAAGLKAVPTGIKHGTVMAVAHGEGIEVTTLRRDVEAYGRHAKVVFTDDWEADAERRDFTINALFCDPDGTLYDPVGGLEDLRAGRVRFVGDARTRIEEDVLRLLRFFRFYASFGRPPPDAEALAACRAMAPALTALSGERVRDELLKLLAAPAPAEVLPLMADAGALAQVLPEVTGFDALAELCEIEDEDADSLRRLALLLRRGRGGAPAVAERLRLPNAGRDRLAAMVEPPVAVVAGLDSRAQRRALYRLGPALFADLVTLAWAETAFHEPGASDALHDLFRAMLETADSWEDPALPVKGADAVALGVPKGPAVGRLLAEVEEWWQAGDYRATRTEALAKLGELAEG